MKIVPSHHEIIQSKHNPYNDPSTEGSNNPSVNNNNNILNRDEGLSNPSLMDHGGGGSGGATQAPPNQNYY